MWCLIEHVEHDTEFMIVGRSGKQAKAYYSKQAPTLFPIMAIITHSNNESKIMMLVHCFSIHIEQINQIC